jgi:hypothetical protein
VGAAPAERRASAILVAGKVYPEGTGIAKRADDYVESVAKFVYQAVQHLEFSDLKGLEARIMELVEQYRKAAGVKI